MAGNVLLCGWHPLSLRRSISSRLRLQPSQECDVPDVPGRCQSAGAGGTRLRGGSACAQHSATADSACSSQQHWSLLLGFRLIKDVNFDGFSF